MKSICIKTNNTNTINYLLTELEYIGLKNVYFSCKKFSKFNNIIIHYKGDNTELFFTKLSTLLSYLIIDNFETALLKKILYTEYFYFDITELNQILSTCHHILDKDAEFNFENRQILLFEILYKYLSETNKIFLNGFINFRLKEYTNFLDDIVDTAVNKYIIEKEYLEFISLLKYYISSQYSKIDCVHLINNYDNFILLDNCNNEIDLSHYMLANKYVSDISFSSNDYILNALLELIPEKIIVHLEYNYKDEFLDTLKLIFDGRIVFCSEASTQQN
jgi:putative sporulation protein YtxC